MATGAAVLACLVYPLLPVPDGLRSVLFLGTSLGTLTALLIGVSRHRPAIPAGWLFFAAGMATRFAGDVTFLTYVNVLHAQPYPSLADVLFLGSMPLLVTGLILIGRNGGRRADRGAALDAAIVAVGCGLIYAVFIVSPILAEQNLGGPQRVTSLAYPIVDLMLLATVARLLLRPGRRGPGLLALAAGCLALLTADLLLTLLTALGLEPGSLVDMAYLLGDVLWAAGALHPSFRRTDDPAPAADGATIGRGRLVVLGACTLLAPAVLFIEGALRGGRISWITVGAGAVALFVLVMVRMSGFVEQTQRQSRQLADAALHDELTGLANRRRFEQRLGEALAAGEPQVALVDLAGFKTINDRLGHATGDLLLAAVADRLTGQLRADADGRPADLVARTGGDEFALLIADATDADGDAVVDRLIAALARPFPVAGHELLVGARIGVTGAGTDDPDELLRRADMALWSAKRQGERTCRWSPSLDERADEKARLGAEIRAALDTGQFHLAYQPIVELPHGRIVAVEALLRWQHPELGFMSPAAFIPVAEENGQIVELGAWVLRTACAQAVTWRTEHGPDAPQRISVNVSARQLAEPGFVATVAEVLAWTGLGAGNLVVEVTETAVFGGGQAVKAVQDLHDLGVRIALDDFGTGHSSLTLLQTVPVDTLKVDRSFVDKVTMAGRHAVIATALIQVADGLGLTAVAEGVETAEQAAELHRLGYRYAQGYHFGRPVPQPTFRAADRPVH